MNSLWFSIYKIISSRTSDSFTSSFQIYMPFISISCPAAVTGTFSTMLNKSCKSGHPCLLTDLKEKLSACHCWVWVAVGLSYVAFFMLRRRPSVSTLLRVFIVNECGILSNAFSVYFKIIIWFLSIMFCIMLTDLQMLSHLWISRINPIQSRFMVLLMYYWIWFANILLRSFTSRFVRNIEQYNFLFLMLSTRFGIRIVLVS